MKRILIGTLIFLVYLALVIAGGFLLHFEGTKLTLFCVILGLIGALTTALILWYMHKQSKAAGTAARRIARRRSISMPCFAMPMRRSSKLGRPALSPWRQCR